MIARSQTSVNLQYTRISTRRAHHINGILHLQAVRVRQNTPTSRRLENILRVRLRDQHDGHHITNRLSGFILSLRHVSVSTNITLIIARADLNHHSLSVNRVRHTHFTQNSRSLANRFLINSHRFPTLVAFRLSRRHRVNRNHIRVSHKPRQHVELVIATHTFTTRIDTDTDTQAIRGPELIIRPLRRQALQNRHNVRKFRRHTRLSLLFNRHISFLAHPDRHRARPNRPLLHVQNSQSQSVKQHRVNIFTDTVRHPNILVSYTRLRQVDVFHRLTLLLFRTGTDSHSIMTTRYLTDIPLRGLHFACQMGRQRRVRSCFSITL